MFWLYVVEPSACLYTCDRTDVKPIAQCQRAALEHAWQHSSKRRSMLASMESRFSAGQQHVVLEYIPTDFDTVTMDGRLHEASNIG